MLNPFYKAKRIRRNNCKIVVTPAPDITSLQLAPSRLVDDISTHFALPEATCGVDVFVDSLIRVSSGIPRRKRRLVMRVHNPGRVAKVLPEAVRIFEHGLATSNSDVVDQAQVRRQFREAHGAIVRDTGNVVFGGHQHDGQALVDTPEPHGVDLAHIGGLGLEELLECHAVLGGFSGSYADVVGLERLPDSGMAEDVIGVRGLCVDGSEYSLAVHPTG